MPVHELFRLAAVLFLLSLSMTATAAEPRQSPNPDEAKALARDVYLYAYPIVLMDIDIQHKSPGKEHESNWLPAPEGRFQVMMRMYSPKAKVLREGPKLPPLKKIGHSTDDE